ncbi:molybdopterin molybdotransferase MoeA [Gaetbulibacter aestuarii]|uniref:Molybdopterin molybdenumtransferase n=1 Tax=Gaetbulibacter aestuarii TaxID=1502358 RepID=A0ABW7N531_9FLAO
MISIEEAKNKVKENTQPHLNKVKKSIHNSGGLTLAETIYSKIDMPPFRQSAMDGYALNLHDSLEYKLLGEIKAGDEAAPKLKSGEAVRIFTGAPVPDSANAVMMQEKVQKEKNIIKLTESISQGTNIRPQGEQVKKGAIALEKGTLLTPAAIGFLSSLGITEVSVYDRPKIAIITTGNELVSPQEPLTYGKIYESNSTMLTEALKALGYDDVSVFKVEDDYEKTKTLLDTAVSNNDLVIITGGISVGDYDFVGKALHEIQVKEIFYKVKQKPGKPLFFGMRNNTRVFALPGNPAASLTCFYIYVYIALQNMMGRTPVELNRVQAKLSKVFVKKGDRPQFLKAIFYEGKVEILEGQNSSMLHTFALANALVFADEATTNIQPGNTLETILLPI